MACQVPRPTSGISTPGAIVTVGLCVVLTVYQSSVEGVRHVIWGRVAPVGIRRADRNTPGVARYTTTIRSKLAPEDAFAYMADFSNARFWDPSVSEARRERHGPVGLGSTFHLVARFAGATCR